MRRRIESGCWCTYCEMKETNVRRSRIAERTAVAEMWRVDTLPTFTDEEFAAMAEKAVCRTLRQLDAPVMLPTIVAKTVGIGEYDALAALSRCVKKGLVTELFSTYQLVRGSE